VRIQIRDKSYKYQLSVTSNLSLPWQTLAVAAQPIICQKSWGRINNNLFTSILTNESNKLDCLSLAGPFQSNLMFPGKTRSEE
jgi:hypothetical protein